MSIHVISPNDGPKLVKEVGPIPGLYTVVPIDDDADDPLRAMLRDKGHQRAYRVHAEVLSKSRSARAMGLLRRIHERADSETLRVVAREAAARDAGGRRGLDARARACEVRPDTEVVRAWPAIELSVGRRDGYAELLSVRRGQSRLLLRVDAWAADALQFVGRQGILRRRAPGQDRGERQRGAHAHAGRSWLVPGGSAGGRGGIIVKERRVSTSWIEKVLAFRAPYLEDKLLKEQIVASRDEAWDLFREVKKYLVIAHCDTGRAYPLFSHRVDAVWNESRALHERVHALLPGPLRNVLAPRPRQRPQRAGGERVAPDKEDHPTNGASAPEEASYDDFCATYQTFFGTPLPPTSAGQLHVGIDVRVRNDHVASTSVRVQEGKAELVRDERCHAARVDAWAEPALRFIATHPSFYPRELPGKLGNADRVALCRALVSSRALPGAA